MKPFLLVSTRPEEEAIDAEYHSYLLVSGLTPSTLEQVRMDMLGLPEVDVNAYSGIFVAGSPYGTTTPTEKKSSSQRRTEEDLAHLFHQILEAKTPCLTTGYGTEVAATVLGGTVTTRWAEPASMVTITLTEEAEGDPLLEDFPRTFTTYVGHHEAVEEVPPGTTVLAKSVTCPTQMMRFGPAFWATQFNPELDSDAINQRLAIYADAGYSGTDDLETLVQIGHMGEGTRQAGQIVKKFVERFRQQ